VNAHGAAAPAQQRARSGGGDALGSTLMQLLTNTAKVSPTQGRTESPRFDTKWEERDNRRRVILTFKLSIRWNF